MTLAFLVSTDTIEGWLSSYGYIVVFVLVMLECLGLPVPGETALIAAALYAGSTGNLEIGTVIIIAAAAAIIGDNIGFAIGRYGGSKVLVKYGHKVRLHEDRLRIGIWLFRHHGGKVVFWGRFVSILRTYAAFLAGANRMSWTRFLFFNTAGGILWAIVFGLGYYFFGNVLERLDKAIGFGLGALGILAIVGFVLWMRKREASLQAKADAEIRGDIADELGQTGSRT